MAGNGNHMPKPEAIWIALGITIAATAIALGPKRRPTFFAAFRTLIAQHESRERVVSFDAGRNHRRAMSQSIRASVSWLLRLIVELDDGVGR